MGPRRTERSRGTSQSCVFFFFNDTATTEIYTLSLHDALPICRRSPGATGRRGPPCPGSLSPCRKASASTRRSEEHTSELQSQSNLVCRLLLEKKKRYRLTCCTYQSLASSTTESPSATPQ